MVKSNSKIDSNQTITPGLCPICHQPNGCHMVSGKDPYSCWCQHTKVPNELLETIPDELRGISCVCKNCVEKYNKVSR